MAPTHGEPRDVRRFDLVPFDKIRLDTTPAFLVKGIVPRVGLCVFWGPPKCGKSFLALDVLMHVALGWKFRDLRVRQGPVVYCAFEGQARLSNRVEAFRQRKLSEDTGDVPFFLVAASMNLVADHSALIASVRAALGDTKPTAICLDTLNRSLVGSESSDEDMAAYVRAADALREAFECVVIIVHHCGIDATRPRGHTSLTGAVDAQIAIKHDAQDNIIAAVEFMKDGPQGAELASRLEVVELGIDEDGDTITSCIVVPVEGAATPTRKAARPKLAKGAKIALRALHDAIGECGAIPPASNHIPADVKTVTVDQWRTYAEKAGITQSPEADALRKAFERAHEALIADGFVGCWTPLVWII
jgi:AAA domain